MRRTMRLALGLAAGLLAFLLTTSPAAAHATFTAASYPVNTDQTLVMNVPHELDDGIFNTEVGIAMASGWTASSCQSKPTWTCSIANESGRQVVRFVKSGTTQAEDETFIFAVHTASNVGTFSFPTIQKYSNGHESAWIGAPGSSEPAPILKTVPAGTPTQPTIAPTTVTHTKPTVSIPTIPGQTTAPAGATTTAPVPTVPGATTTTLVGGESTTTVAGDPGTPGSSEVPGSPAGTAAIGPTSGGTLPGGAVTSGSTPPGAGPSDVASDTRSTGSSAAGPLVAGAIVLAILAAGGGFLLRQRRQTSP